MNIMIVHSVDNAQVLKTILITLVIIGSIGGAVCLCVCGSGGLGLVLGSAQKKKWSTKVDTDEEVRANPLKEKNSEEVKGMFVEMTLPISEKGASILPVLIPLGLAKYAGQLIDEGFESASDLCLATEADLISIGMLHAEAQSLLCNFSHVLPATGAEGGTGAAVVAAGKAQSRAARLRQMREAKAAMAAANAAGSGGGLARRDSLIIHGTASSEV
jgi:hypothetical protein